jgi:pimeloyl-ACP methyl ester carboxylesterase
MKHVRAGVLNVAYEEHGPCDGRAVVLLHGFPYDIRAYDGVVPILAAKGMRCLVPYLRGYGATSFVDAAAPRSGQQAALGTDLRAFMDALGVGEAVLGGYDWGGRAACIVAALWPERATGLVSCGRGYNIQDLAKGEEPVAPEQEHRLWYQHYFRTERGRAGLAANRSAFCRLLWRLWSPRWNFADLVFEQTVGSFDNADFLDVVIHSYRHRFGGVAGDPSLDAIEALLAEQPAIAVPSIVLLGGDDGVEPPTENDTAAVHFSGPYARRVVCGIGHNFPQEAPRIFAEAVSGVSS